MKVVVLDEVKERHRRLRAVLEARPCTPVLCQGTAEFMEEILHGSPDRIAMDVRSWGRGGPVYRYFEFGHKLEEIPIVFYNAPEGFVTIGGRRRHDRDRVVFEDDRLETLAEAIG
jgi:hypothetical protein